MLERDAKGTGQPSAWRGHPAARPGHGQYSPVIRAGDQRSRAHHPPGG